MTVVAAVNLAELEALARDVLPEPAYHYFAGGAADEITMRANRTAYDELVLLPRVLRGGGRTLATRVLGLDLALPALVAPVAFQRAAHPDGELAMVRGATAAGMPLCLSSFATVALEEVAAAAAPGVPLLFQLYPYADRAMTEEVVLRAAAAGFRALVVTVDVSVHGRRERELRHGFALAPGLELPSVPVPADHVGPVSPRDVSTFLAPDLDWEDLERLMGLTDLPVVVKGILTPADAELAAKLGVAGIVVSNHGGRQLDTAPATLDVLPEIAAAVGDRVDVLVDGGVRRGTDVVKALALGARAVLVGRPLLWALAAGGADGVRAAAELLREEVDVAFTLCGLRAPEEATAALVRRGGDA